MLEPTDPSQLNPPDISASVQITRTQKHRVLDLLVRMDNIFWVYGMSFPIAPLDYGWPFFGLVFRFLFTLVSYSILIFFLCFFCFFCATQLRRFYHFDICIAISVKTCMYFVGVVLPGRASPRGISYCWGAHSRPGPYSNLKAIPFDPLWVSR